MLLVKYVQKSYPDITKSAKVEFPPPRNSKEHDRLIDMVQRQLGINEPITLMQVDKIKSKPVDDDNPDQVDRNAEYRGGKQRENAKVQMPPPVTWRELREFVGQIAYDKIVGFFSFNDDDVVDAEFLIERYSAEGGLQLFLSECFPASCSKKPYGKHQLQSIATCESIIRNGGVQQSLLPRAFGKTAAINRSAIWALMFGFRKCCICFQSSLKKSRQAVDRSTAELCNNVAIRAMLPKLSAAMLHGRMNLALQSKQHIDGRLTNVQLLSESIKLPTIYKEDGSPEPYSGARLFAMPFGKGAGISLIDHDTLADIRIDLCLIDDPQSHDDALRGASPKTKQLVDIWNESIRYLGGRDKSPATFFTQTIVRMGDFASQIEADPSIQTIKFGLVITFPENEKIWLGPYRDIVLDYDPMDPDGQAIASERARQFYLANREEMDRGSEVSWEFAYDPEKVASPLEQAYRNMITNSEAFWAQDQNSTAPQSQASDIRCKPSDITKKQHPEPRGIIPDFCDRLVAHIDVHDHLLYVAVAAGNAEHSAAVVDYFTWPKQSLKYYTMDQAPNRFDRNPEYMRLPTNEDRIRHGINTLVDHLVEQEWKRADGTVLNLEVIGVDCADQMDLVHSIARDNRHKLLLPIRGISAKPTDTRLNETPKKPNEKRRGDNWIEKRSERTGQLWVTFDTGYYKHRAHTGFLAPITTTNSVSLFNANPADHTMIAEQFNNESPSFVKADNKPNGCWVWKKLPGDNHFFDCCVNTTMLLNRAGACFADVGRPKQRAKPVAYVSAADAWAEHQQLWDPNSHNSPYYR